MRFVDARAWPIPPSDHLRTYSGLLSAETIFLLAGEAQITDVSTNTNELNEGDVLSLRGEFLPGILTDPYTVTVDWGDGTAPSHADLTPGIGSFAIDHVIAEPPPSGDLATILVTVVGSGPSATATRNVTVHNVNDPPVLANAISDQVAIEDLGFSYTIPAYTFAIADQRFEITGTTRFHRPIIECVRDRWPSQADSSSTIAGRFAVLIRARGCS